MNVQNQENIKNLFERFVSTEEAESRVEDFVKAERILHQYPAPEPAPELIAAIKSDIAETLRRRKEHTFRRIAYKLAPVAAVFIILASVSIRLYERNSSMPVNISYASMIPAAIWESDNIAADDPVLAILTVELDAVEGELLTLELGENVGNGRSAVSELEMDFVAISTDIWEG